MNLKEVHRMAKTITLKEYEALKDTMSKPLVLEFGANW